ncbi:type I restriction endonuclease subunit R [Candidatus Endomicrobiellum trichonymphae]|uniref:type I restriction endonuclease subunit R n=1 Tax=Endomicrobium trichonymphae TaxID=1408204 RepID=UPI000BBAA12B|nr:type I restriction endonuclease [Candidatus Endomicrobium trichonymphae]
MPIKTKEITFENEIENILLKNGYIKGNPADYDKKYALDTALLFKFLQNSQSKEWGKLVNKYGDGAEKSFLRRLGRELESKGMLYLLRNGIIDTPAKFELCFFEPASNMNETDIEHYKKNILSITRQVHYSLKSENSIDIVIFINGLPVSTIELKNPVAGQTVGNAKKQYKYDRDPRELLLSFKTRCLVHFAVDTDEIYMTTKLCGADTYFLPFNKGDGHGKGNPLNSRGYRTSYLWEDVLQKDSLLDIIRRFIHLEVKDKKENIIFPRYHQLDAVRKLIADVKANGSGKNYLIQHSAGSGKSNSIAWLAHHLQNLHDTDDKIIFNSVVVVTDRKVLDRELQDTIYQFEHIDGVVAKIDVNSKQLAEALKTGRKIIITTLQKFPFVLEEVKDLRGLKGKRFAVIIDEAHSSQTGGGSSSKLKAVLGDDTAGLSECEKLQKTADEEAKEEKNIPDSEDIIRKEMKTHGRLKNLSFFAFTATPKPATIEMFGNKGDDGKPKAFHLYSMRQAVEEGFILDVLKNYMTYTTYFRLGKAIANDPRYDKSRANKALGKFLSLHPHNLAQKTQIMVEHFRSVTKNKICGKAKAMVVTSSRLHAVRYYFEFKKYIKKMGYQKELRVLVAFSGTVSDEGKESTEQKLNNIKETELKEKFKGTDYQILLVAEKYQTGYDEPLLHTMFIDKKLGGVKAVQTLSRLNRICPGKEDTFILDFVNSAEDIKKSFKPYYKAADIEETTDANIVYDIKSKLDEFRIYWDTEIENFANVFFKPSKKQENLDFSILNSYIDPAVDRYEGKNEEEQEEFKSNLTKFVRAYSFISNIIKLDDVKMHKFFAYSKYLLRKLPKDKRDEVNLNDEITLQYYRVQKIFEGSIILEEENNPLKNYKYVSKVDTKYETASLSELIEKLNERFGTDFTVMDKVLQQFIADMEKDENLRKQAMNNSKEHFKFPFNDAFMTIVVDRMVQNKEFCERILDDEKFGKTVKELLSGYMYDRLRKTDSVKIELDN